MSDQASAISAGDTAWLLIGAALVMLMTPGLAFFYGGMVRRTNVLGILMQNFTAVAIVSLLWVQIGFSDRRDDVHVRVDDLPYRAEVGQHLGLVVREHQHMRPYRILRRPVRIGRPLGLAGLPEAAKGPAFAVAAGLLVYPQAAHLEHFEPRRTRQLMTGTGGYMARVGRWLRESF